MSIKEIPPETVKAVAALAAALGGTSFHMTPIFVCDYCKDDEQEAFPYYAIDKDGGEWAHLCNQCFDVLECRFDDDGAIGGR